MQNLSQKAQVILAHLFVSDEPILISYPHSPCIVMVGEGRHPRIIKSIDIVDMDGTERCATFWDCALFFRDMEAHAVPYDVHHNHCEINEDARKGHIVIEALGDKGKCLVTVSHLTAGERTVFSVSAESIRESVSQIAAE